MRVHTAKLVHESDESVQRLDLEYVSECARQRLPVRVAPMLELTPTSAPMDENGQRRRPLPSGESGSHPGSLAGTAARRRW